MKTLLIITDDIGWWCPRCSRNVAPEGVTYEEECAVCGTPVMAGETKIATLDDIMEALSERWQPMETAPTDGRRVLLKRGKSKFTGYYGGANSGWRYTSAVYDDAIWPLPDGWLPVPK